MITQKFFKLPDKLIFLIIILFYTQIFNLDAKSKVCETLLDVLEINTNAYKNCLLKKYRKKLLKTDEITKDLFEEKYRYQWRNRH